MKIKPVKHIKVEKNMKVSELVSKMKKTGFNARALGEAISILQEAKQKKCVMFLGLAGALVPAGMKQVIIDLINKNYVDVLVSTGANLTHDVVEALGFKHYLGDEKANDKKLHVKGIDRIYNVFMPNRCYVAMEKFFVKNFSDFRAQSASEFLQQLGKLMPSNSILKTCTRKNIPVFCPALSNSGIGLMLWNLMIRKKKIIINELIDINKIINLAWSAKKSCVFYVNGGEPKNYIQQAMQFSKAASYGVQITREIESFGGSGGAPLREGISWGKMASNAKFVDIFCDATIALPLIVAALK